MTANEYKGYLLACNYSALHLREFADTITGYTEQEWQKSSVVMSAPRDKATALQGIAMALSFLGEATAQSVPVDDLPSSFNQGQV